jgi:hypothetical protein
MAGLSGLTGKDVPVGETLPMVWEHLVFLRPAVRCWKMSILTQAVADVPAPIVRVWRDSAGRDLPGANGCPTAFRGRVAGKLDKGTGQYPIGGTVMRLTRIAFVITAMALGSTSTLRGQHSGYSEGGSCACGACAGMVGECCCPPLLPSLSESVRSVQHALGSLLCCPGLNARHDIYRAALRRNDFGKCNTWFWPVYSCRNCCCGGAATGCPHCGVTHPSGGEVIEMHEVAPGEVLEPTPALAPPPLPAASQSVPPQAARRRPTVSGRASASRPAVPSASRHRSGSGSLRDRVARGDSTRAGVDEAPRPAKSTRRSPAPGDPPVRRASLVETLTGAEPTNPLRK